MHRLSPPLEAFGWCWPGASQVMGQLNRCIADLHNSHMLALTSKPNAADTYPPPLDGLRPYAPLFLPTQEPAPVVYWNELVPDSFSTNEFSQQYQHPQAYIDNRRPSISSSENSNSTNASTDSSPTTSFYSQSSVGWDSNAEPWDVNNDGQVEELHSQLPATSLVEQYQTSWSQPSGVLPCTNRVFYYPESLPVYY